MEVTVNDKKINIPDHTSLQGALNLAGINPEGVATALNGEVAVSYTHLTLPTTSRV